MKFYGRDSQRHSLHQLIKRNKLQVGLIYGRKRVGKSELIKQVLRESPIRSIYCLCKQTTEPNNMDSLAVLISECFHFPKPSFSSLEELLNDLFQHAENVRITNPKFPIL